MASKDAERLTEFTALIAFTRGPAIKYNRWLAGGQSLPFEKEERDGDAENW